jgi:hypothetical protein
LNASCIFAQRVHACKQVILDCVVSCTVVDSFAQPKLGQQLKADVPNTAGQPCGIPTQGQSRWCCARMRTAVGDGVVTGPTSLCELLHSEKLGDGRCTLSPPKAGGLADAFWGSDFSLWHCVMWHCVTVGLSWQQQQQQAGRQARQSLSRSRLGAMEAPGRAEIYQAGRHQTAGGCIRGSRCS